METYEESIAWLSGVLNWFEVLELVATMLNAGISSRRIPVYPSQQWLRCTSVAEVLLAFAICSV